MPLRWQCPEAIVTRTYTAKSDVFSYGVCLWEIYAEGAVPYAGMTSEAAFQAVKAGHRLSRPSASTSDVIVTLIRDCMAARVQHRPSMTDVHHRLAQHMRDLGAEPAATASAAESCLARGATRQVIAWPSSSVEMDEHEESAL